ncbi:gliding motility protein [Aquiflexum sp. LQ15W]|uniref:type IX secretion system periplasmic lipoprotein PorW/SprE n=1 Tax=Cognataquiflexum nitidum TaxID=2922272 RepID=UPI001F13533D|nr:gliding motility protein [Cognataquiflexum nitidum]MCH6199017.1 gliding motility protein [Cognataquiflexum nitidum]
MNRIVFLLFFLFSIGLLSCSSERNTFTNRLFHNTTARYNAYYYADTKISELEAGIAKNHREDFSQVLPVFYTIDSTFIDSNKELLGEVRSFASKAVDWHRISKWVGPSYFLIGMADYYEAKFDDASNTFKYLNVNGKKKDIRHRSLIQLMRLFTDLENFDDAAYVIDFLSKESGISSENKFLLYKTLAYYYHNRGELNGKIGALDKSLGYTKDKKEKSRINFILGQLYQREGIDALAYDYYMKSVKGNPPYERAFFAQLYAQQVAELNQTKDIDKVRNYFDGLYKDSKNKDLKDVILFEKANFELKQGDIEAAESLLIRAAKEESQNPIQKGYIYEKLAMVNFDKKNDFRAAKFYLDSALVNFRPTDPLFQNITARKEILDKYVFHYDIVTKNDSLLLLADLSLEAQTLIAENFIKQEEERLLREAAAKDVQKPSSIFDNLLAFGGRGGSGESFYFNNSVAIQQGSIDFNRNWGNRPLQDNWRRTSQNFQTSSTRPAEVTTTSDTTSAGENPILSGIPTTEELLSKIPSNPDQISEMKVELERSYFELGKILFFDFKNPVISIENLESLITKYPNTIKKPEAYYILYLANKETGGNTDIFAQRLNREFPDSPFTMSVNNPDQASGNVAFLETSRNYKRAYELYHTGQYADAKSLIRSTLESHPLTANTDRLLLLDIMVTGKTEDISRYQERLENYIQTTEDEGLAEMARNMLGAFKVDEEQTEAEVSEESETEVQEEALADEGPEEEEAEAESPYKNNPNQTHIFVIVLGADKSGESKNLLADLEGFHNENFKGSRLRTGNMNLSRENTIFIVSPFISAQKGIEYREKFMEGFNNASMTDEDKANCFLISIENFQELNKRKNLDEYRDFYTNTYY